MADDASDKTEPATPRKREEAREQGQVAKSMDLTAAVVLLAAVLLMGWFGPTLAQALRDVMAETFSPRSLADFHPGSAATLALRGLVIASMGAAPLIGGLVVAALLANIVQVGLHATPKRIMPKLDSLSPLKGAKRLFGSASTLVQTAMNVLKIVIVGAIGYSAVHARLGEIVAAQQLDFVQAFGMGAGLIYDVALRVAVALFVLALVDYVWKRFKHERDLRMSKQEVKDEMKRMEGDPLLKQRRRQIAQKMSRDRQKRAVPTADVVVTNPTEYAVALKYEAGSMAAPRVVAKGRGLIAAEIRRIAIENGVPILERPPLARALYKLVEVGGYIPEEFYSAVAEILAYVYELTGKLRRGREVAA
jgi:flagellar biosynthesis protein FlhB